MLKVCLGFVVSVVVLLSSAYVFRVTPRAYAASASIVITQIQAGGVGAATQEFIVIYNNSPDEVDITGWCLINKNNVTITCFKPPLPGQAMYLPAYKHAVVVSNSLPSTLLSGGATMTYVPISQSSGSIIGGSDTISLVDQTGNVIDRQSWTTSLAGGMQFERQFGTEIPVVYHDTDSPSDWTISSSRVLPSDETQVDTTIVDICPNIDGLQVLLPVGKELHNGDCVDKVIPKILVTELFPNAVGSDVGQEFIELYNPNNQPIALSSYQLYVGNNLDDMYNFPTGATIQAHDYLSFSNTDIAFTLLNSSSKVLVALSPDGIVVSETPAYTSPPEGESWALIDDVWQYTNQPTPGAANVASDDTTLSVEATLLPCAANQYRSPDTNRCRLISSQTGTVTPCKDGQYRSEETNRCRNIATDAKVVTPCSDDEVRNPDTNRCRKIVTATTQTACKEGQERNPDTNRCRTIVKMPTAQYGVLGAQTKKGGNFYVIAAVGGILLLALGYAIWEWHAEIATFFRKLWYRVNRFVRIRK